MGERHHNFGYTIGNCFILNRITIPQEDNGKKQARTYKWQNSVSIAENVLLHYLKNLNSNHWSSGGMATAAAILPLMFLKYPGVPFCYQFMYEFLAQYLVSVIRSETYVCN